MPIHPFWIAAILIIVLIVFGPSRLPELGSAVGYAVRFTDRSAERDIGIPDRCSHDR